MRSLIIFLVFMSGCAAVAPPTVPMRDQGNIAQLTADEGTCDTLFCRWPLLV